MKKTQKKYKKISIWRTIICYMMLPAMLFFLTRYDIVSGWQKPPKHKGSTAVEKLIAFFLNQQLEKSTRYSHLQQITPKS